MTTLCSGIPLQHSLGSAFGPATQKLRFDEREIVGEIMAALAAAADRAGVTN